MADHEDLIRRDTQDVMARVLGLDPREVHPDARIREDLGHDSYDLFEILDEMESRFGVPLSDRDLEEAATVADIVAAARRAIAAGREPPRSMAVARRRDALSRRAS